MSHLDTSFRGSGHGINSVTTPTSEEDLLSVKSDDSDVDSECFVVISQGSDHGIDSTLFAINSKRTSPVEVAAEAVEDSSASTYASSCDLRGTTPGPPSNVASVSVDPPPPQRDGVVSS
jgi:hypothetical protein